MFKRSCIAMALAALVAAPISAKDEDGDKPDSERVVCKREKPTGSRLPGERICKTKAEWDRDKAEARRQADELYDDRASTMNTGG